jgi:membrane protease YdiL (CAAX protease family)
LDLPIPVYIIVVPIIEVLVVAITLVFAKYKHANFYDLGLKKTSPKILARYLIGLVPLYIVTAAVTVALTSVFGPDPLAEAFTIASIPRDPFQLVAYVIIYLVLVGPAEELAFRGFIQKGFENSFGKMKGIFIASILFGLPHIANYPYNAVAASASGLVLGYIWQKTDQNTTATALIHGIYNSIGIILVYLGNI